MGEAPSPAKLPGAAGELLRFGLVGVLSNFSGYLLYLLATYLGATPKSTMSLFYVVGAAIGFWGNRTITFGHRGSLTAAGIRYMAAHLVGYLMNLSMLLVFVDGLGFPHQLVQAIAILVVAAFLFVAFKLFVFPAPSGRERAG